MYYDYHIKPDIYLSFIVLVMLFQDALANEVDSGTELDSPNEDEKDEDEKKED